MFLAKRRPLSDANAFATAAGVYWLEVFPHVKRELRHWQERAARIADRRLAALALQTLVHEHGNLEGAAVFALLAPRALRGEVIRATVAFQALYDFLDTLAELPVADPAANGRRLHRALPAALAPGTAPENDYLAGCGFRGQEGYLRELIGACHRAVARLPGYAHAAVPAREAAERMVEYQALNHVTSGAGPQLMQRWGETVVPSGSGLRWWEAAAGGASSLGVFALLAAASSPELDATGAAATADAYFPWAGALHVLLDSLVDVERDLASGDHSLVSHYGSSEEAAERLGSVAREAARQTRELGPKHSLILAAMAGFYLSRPAARGPFTASAYERVACELGPWARPAIAVVRASRAVRAISGKSSSGLSTCPGDRGA